METIGLTRSRTGLPVVTESGGGATNTGSGEIIAGAHGEKLRPLFVPHRGYSEGTHALFVARPGMLVARADRSREGTTVTVYRITEIPEAGTADPDEAGLEVVGVREYGDTDLPDELGEMADAAEEKAACYHCREAHYALRGDA